MGHIAWIQDNNKLHHLENRQSHCKGITYAKTNGFRLQLHLLIRGCYGSWKNTMVWRIFVQTLRTIGQHPYENSTNSTTNAMNTPNIQSIVDPHLIQKNHRSITPC